MAHAWAVGCRAWAVGCRAWAVGCLVWWAVLGVGVAAPADADAPTLRERLAGFSAAGHRGSSVRADGNTIAGFERARAAGADIIEMDLRTTADGVAVVYHDPSIKASTTGCTGEIAEMTLAEVRTCEVGGQWAVPTFEEVLQWADGRVVINAEFKDHASIAPAMALVGQYGAHAWVYFQCKSDRLRYELARTQDAQVALLFKPATETDLAWILEVNDPRLVVIELDGALLRPDVVARVQAAGKLASANAWPRSFFEEVLWDACDRIYAEGIDIAVSKHPGGCAAAAAAWNAGHGSHTTLWFERGLLVVAPAGLTLLLVAGWWVLVRRWRTARAPA